MIDKERVEDMEKKIKHQIANRMAGLRAIKGWSQEELAERSGVSRSFVGQMEREESQPTIGKLAQIAVAFNVEIDYFLSTEEQISAKYFANVLPDDLRELFLSQKGRPYLNLISQVYKWALNPETVQEMLSIFHEHTNKSS